MTKECSVCEETLEKCNVCEIKEALKRLVNDVDLILNYNDRQLVLKKIRERFSKFFPSIFERMERIIGDDKMITSFSNLYNEPCDNCLKQMVAGQRIKHNGSIKHVCTACSKELLGDWTHGK